MRLSDRESLTTICVIELMHTINLQHSQHQLLPNKHPAQIEINCLITFHITQNIVHNFLPNLSIPLPYIINNESASSLSKKVYIVTSHLSLNGTLTLTLKQAISTSISSSSKSLLQWVCSERNIVINTPYKSSPRTIHKKQITKHNYKMYLKSKQEHQCTTFNSQATIAHISYQPKITLKIK